MISKDNLKSVALLNKNSIMKAKQEVSEPIKLVIEDTINILDFIIKQ